jgi:hypothetical protein
VWLPVQTEVYSAPVYITKDPKLMPSGTESRNPFNKNVACYSPYNELFKMLHLFQLCHKYDTSLSQSLAFNMYLWKSQPKISAYLEVEAICQQMFLSPWQQELRSGPRHMWEQVVNDGSQQEDTPVANICLQMGLVPDLHHSHPTNRYVIHHSMSNIGTFYTQYMVCKWKYK